MRRGKTERITVLPSSSHLGKRAYDEGVDTAHGWPRIRMSAPLLRTGIRLPVPPRLYNSRFLKPTWILRAFLLSVCVVGFYVWLRVRSWRTLVYSHLDLQRIYRWEIESGHYPSSRPVPSELGFTGSTLANPARAPQRLYTHAQPRSRDQPLVPVRPVPGSVADLDKILTFCDYSTGKYVRDCLEALRVGGGLDNLRGRSSDTIDAWKYIFLDEPSMKTGDGVTHISTNASQALTHKPGAREQLWLPQVTLAPPVPGGTCDPVHPRIFHMFWAGPFTDKPYMALLSYLYTQNLGLGNSTGAPAVCRPRFWVWIHSADRSTNLTATLEANSWSAPFLHPRFKDVIEFKVWETAEQMDNIPELKEDWRLYKDKLLNSGGHVVKIKSGQKLDYDKPSVVLSDLARFVLCHRFGGIYLDADTLLLRDWEELWGWRGAFAYKWSHHDKYNTAVLRMHERSALGTFLIRTALRNGLDFHPMTISKYLKEARLEGLLFRCPDALFDPAFITAEKLHLERPPFPAFPEFAHFFDTPTLSSASPQVAGFDAFFRGAWGYHWHNFWRQSFDPDNDWPDLGPRFHEGEARQRNLLYAERTKALRQNAPAPTAKAGSATAQARRDLSWATVMKRTLEAYIRGERPNMYGEWLLWPTDPDGTKAVET